jgi:hypothetical protein
MRLDYALSHRTTFAQSSMTGPLALVLIAALALCPRAALALDGQDLLKKCKDTNVASQAFCLGYITGISDTLESKSGLNSSLICRASGVGPDQLRRVVLKFLRSHSEGHANADSEVGQALIETFPCKDEQDENTQ